MARKSNIREELEIKGLVLDAPASRFRAHAKNDTPLLALIVMAGGYVAPTQADDARVSGVYLVNEKGEVILSEGDVSVVAGERANANWSVSGRVIIGFDGDRNPVYSDTQVTTIPTPDSPQNYYDAVTQTSYYYDFTRSDGVVYTYSTGDGSYAISGEVADAQFTVNSETLEMTVGGVQYDGWDSVRYTPKSGYSQADVQRVTVDLNADGVMTGRGEGVFELHPSDKFDQEFLRADGSVVRDKYGNILDPDGNIILSNIHLVESNNVAQQPDTQAPTPAPAPTPAQAPAPAPKPAPEAVSKSNETPPTDKVSRVDDSPIADETPTQNDKQVETARETVAVAVVVKDVVKEVVPIEETKNNVTTIALDEGDAEISLGFFFFAAATDELDIV